MGHVSVGIDCKCVRIEQVSALSYCEVSQQIQLIVSEWNTGERDNGGETQTQ